MKHLLTILLSSIVSTLIAASVVTVMADDAGRQPDRVSEQRAVSTVGAAFTYQGRLDTGSGPATGAHDLRFRLFEDIDGLTAVSGFLDLGDVVVTNGLFTVDLDFGASPFGGQARFLEVRVRPGAETGIYTPLQPLQRLSPVPYAVYANTSGSANTATTAASVPWTGLTEVPAGFLDGFDADALAGLSCTSGQVPKRQGIAWICGEDIVGAAGSTYTAQSPVALINSTAFGFDTTGCVAGEIWKYSGATWNCDPDAIGAAVGHNHYGEAWSGGGAGGLKVTNTTSGNGFWGESVDGIGVYGTSTSWIGVQGSSPSGTGVFGTSTSGTGVSGTSPSGTGVSGDSVSGYGVRGNSTSSAGVYGSSTTGQAVLAVTQATINPAIIGYGPKGSIGVDGRSAENLSTTTEAHIGVVGRACDQNGNCLYQDAVARNSGVYGESGTGAGVRGITTTGIGVRGSSSSSFGVSGSSTSSVGVYGIGGFAGLYGDRTGTGLAGYFNGPVTVAGGHGINCASCSPVISDARSKTNIEDLRAGLPELLKLRAVRFNYLPDYVDDNGKDHQGLLAQDVLEVLPANVFERGDGLLGVNYPELIPVLIKAIQEQQAQIEALKGGAGEPRASVTNLAPDAGAPASVTIVREVGIPAGAVWALAGAVALFALSMFVVAGAMSRRRA